MKFSSGLFCGEHYEVTCSLHTILFITFYISVSTDKVLNLF